MMRRVLQFAGFMAVISAALTPTLADAATRLVFKEETEIIGEVQKPEVAVFITRQNLNKAYQLELKESFLPKIIQSVEKAPF